LVEALVALTIIACLFGAIGSVFATATLGAHSLEGHLAVVQTARTLAASFSVDDALRNPEGNVDGVAWKISVSPFPAENHQSKLVPVKLKIDVRAPTGASYSLETIRLQQRITN